jgi:hypothetical integral membrane protein (TIGR02206 family)
VPHTFEPFSALHAGVVVVSIALWWGAVRWARAVVGTPRERAWRRGAALLVWGPNVAWMLRQALPDHFQWSHSLPLHLCDLAWAAAGWSLWSEGPPTRLRHQVPVLWAFALSMLGYATPAVTSGPGGIHFWTFWGTHWQILAVALVNVFARGVRPDVPGLLGTLGITLAAFAVATALNLALGTSYFFTGDDVPSNPSPLDLLGPWPLRILWIALLGAAAIVATALPFLLRRRDQRSP